MLRANCEAGVLRSRDKSGPLLAFIFISVSGHQKQQQQPSWPSLSPSQDLSVLTAELSTRASDVRKGKRPRHRLALNKARPISLVSGARGITRDKGHKQWKVQGLNLGGKRQTAKRFHPTKNGGILKAAKELAKQLFP